MLQEEQTIGAAPLRHVSEEEVHQALTGGIVFKGSKLKAPAKTNGVKTKAKKKG